MSTTTLHSELGRLARNLELQRSLPSDDQAWFTETERLLLAFRDQLSAHTRAVIEDDLYHDVVFAAPRVASMVQNYTAQCFKLDELASQALATAHRPDRSVTDTTDAVGQLLRLAERQVAGALASDHEAFSVDLGGRG